MGEPGRIKRRRKHLRDNQSIILLGAYVLCNRIPAWLLETFDSAHVPPEPPMVKQSVIGGGVDEVENRDDPAFVLELQEYENRQGQEMANLCFDFAESLPETAAQEQEWVNKLKRWGIPDTSENRLKAFCLPDARVHTTALVKEVMRLSTITQEEEDAATARFQPSVDGPPGGAVSSPEEQLDV